MRENKNSRDQKNDTGRNDSKSKQNTSSENLDELTREADKERTRKPGSQSNSSKQGNNGRGGGK